MKLWRHGFFKIRIRAATLPGSCRRHGINPFDYPKDLFTRLPAAKITQIKEFTPAAWAKAKSREKGVAQAA
jgi:hypothetical protein